MVEIILTPLVRRRCRNKERTQRQYKPCIRTDRQETGTQLVAYGNQPGIVCCQTQITATCRGTFAIFRCISIFVKLRRMRLAGHVARMGEGRGVHRVLVGKPEGKRPMGRPRRRWEDNIKMDLQEVGGGCGDWVELVQDRDRWRALVRTMMNLRVPKMRGIS